MSAGPCHRHENAAGGARGPSYNPASIGPGGRHMAKSAAKKKSKYSPHPGLMKEAQDREKLRARDREDLRRVGRDGAQGRDRRASANLRMWLTKETRPRHAHGRGGIAATAVASRRRAELRRLRDARRPALLGIEGRVASPPREGDRRGARVRRRRDRHLVQDDGAALPEARLRGTASARGGRRGATLDRREHGQGTSREDERPPAGRPA